MENTIVRRENARRGMIAAFVLAILLAAALVLVSVLGNPSSSGASDAPKPIPTPTATSTPTPIATPTATAVACEPEFVQVKLDRKGSPKVDPEFATKVDKAVKSGDKDAYRKVVLNVSAHNGQLLGVYAHQMGLFEDPTEWKTLVDGTCLSEDGKDLYHDLNVAYHVTGMTFGKGEAPANANNSGIGSSGQYGMDANSGIGGDRTAIEITLPDGSKTWIMFRCGNPVFLSKPKGLPTVPTDNPKPVTPTTPTTPGNSNAKDQRDSVQSPQGWTPVYSNGPKTSDQVNEQQQSSGQVSGNVTDNKVPSGTKSGSTTPDLPKGTVTAPGANSGSSGSGGENTKDDTVDPGVTNDDTGGTGGDTEIAPPPD